MRPFAMRAAVCGFLCYPPEIAHIVHNLTHGPIFRVCPKFSPGANNVPSRVIPTSSFLHTEAQRPIRLLPCLTTHSTHRSKDARALALHSSTGLVLLNFLSLRAAASKATASEADPYIFLKSDRTKKNSMSPPQANCNFVPFACKAFRLFYSNPITQGICCLTERLGSPLLAEAVPVMWSKDLPPSSETYQISRANLTPGHADWSSFFTHIISALDRRAL